MADLGDVHQVEINNSPYLVLRNTYQRLERPGYAERVATGTPGYQDDMLFINLAQSDWTGGYNYDYLGPDENTFKDSTSIDVIHKSGEMRLSKKLKSQGGFASVNLSASANAALSTCLSATPVANLSNYPSSGTVRFGEEEVTYAAIVTAAGFSACTRGDNNTSAQAHAIAVSAEQVAEVVALQEYDGEFYSAMEKNLWKSTDGSSWSVLKRFNASADIVDLETFEGQLYVALGADGYENYDGSSWADDSEAVNYFCAADNHSRLYATYDNVLKYSQDPEAASPSWTTAKTLSSDETEFPGKPVLHNGVVFFNANKGSEANGRSTLYYYGYGDGTVIPVVRMPYPMGKEIPSFNGMLYFFLQEIEQVTIYEYNGSSAAPIWRQDVQGSTAKYGTFKYGTGIKYGAGSEVFSDPIKWEVNEGNLYFTMDSTASTNHIYVYNGIGFSRANTITGFSDNSYELGVFKKQLYAADTRGELYVKDTTFETSGNLISSFFDANQFSIDKKFVDITAYHEKLPSGCSVALYYRVDEITDWVQAGSTNSTLDSTKTEGTIPITNNYGKKIQYKIDLTGSAAETPTIKDVVIKLQRIVPYKKDWRFGVVVVENIEYLDGDRETGSAEDILGYIETAREATETGTITFEDIDGVSYNVDKMELGVENPLINKQDGLEHIVSVRLIET